MTASKGSPAFGTLLQIGDGLVSESFTTIAEVKNLSGPAFAREFAEITNHSSADGYREYVPTFKSSGEVSFTCNFINDGTQDDSTGLLADFDAGTLRNFRMIFTLTDGSQYKCLFSAHVANFGPISANMDGILEAPCTLRISGPAPISTYIPAT